MKGGSLGCHGVNLSERRGVGQVVERARCGRVLEVVTGIEECQAVTVHNLLAGHQFHTMDGEDLVSVVVFAHRYIQSQVRGEHKP